ncbi:MAG: glycosyltransferase family 4 protein [Clostridia bacterium]|nr:glycosyltransferase family 4 protein [Clostridia bacterium]
MNVLIFSRILEKTGVGNYIKQLSEQLNNEGHKVIVVSNTKKQDIADGVGFIKIPAASNNPLKIISCVKKLREIIKKNNIDVVHCHHRKAALIMRIYNIFFSVPVVYTLHLANIPSDFIHRKMTFVGNKAIAISNEVREFLITKIKIPAKKIATVYNGVKVIERLSDDEIIEIKKEWNIPDGKYVIVMHSRIDKVKNQIIVVEAINELPDSIKQQIIVVCSGEKTGQYYDELVDKINAYGLQKNFVFVGWVSAEKIFSVADFMFLPSTNEGFALSVAEAFMMRVPVARTKTAGYEEQKYCLPIKADSTLEIKEILCDLCVNGKDQYKEIIDKAYELAMKEFTIEVMTKRNIDVYKEVSGKK